MLCCFGVIIYDDDDDNHMFTIIVALCRDFGRVPWFSAIDVILGHGCENQRTTTVCNFSIWTVADVGLAYTRKSWCGRETAQCRWLNSIGLRIEIYMQRHRAVLPAIARLLYDFILCLFFYHLFYCTSVILPVLLNVSTNFHHLFESDVYSVSTTLYTGDKPPIASPERAPGSRDRF